MLPLPLAIAREVADSMQLADGSDDGVRLARPSSHLERLKQGLLLYVQAKYVTRVPFTSLEPRLIQLGIGARSVNGAWGVVRDSLRELPALLARVLQQLLVVRHRRGAVHHRHQRRRRHPRC